PSRNAARVRCALSPRLMLSASSGEVTSEKNATVDPMRWTKNSPMAPLTPMSSDRARKPSTSLGFRLANARPRRRGNAMGTISSRAQRRRRRPGDRPVPPAVAVQDFRTSGLQNAHALEDLDPVVGGVRHVDEAGLLVDDDAVEIAELTDARAL